MVLVSVAGAGALGAVSRYALSSCLRELFGAGPAPIAFVNVVGCFGFGLCAGLLEDRVSQAVYVGVLAGFFGAFTTFSAFAFDGVQLLEDRRFLAFFGNLSLQNALGAGGLWMGLALASRG